MKKYLTLILFTAILLGCDKEEKEKIDIELLDYITTFEVEAKKRGMLIDVESMDFSAHIMNIEEEGILGQCLSYDDDSRQIIIDISYWQNLNSIDREYLIMHELGHCVLERGHLDNRDESGNCISIMQSGLAGCRKRYTENNRSELLDELFSY